MTASDFNPTLTMTTSGVTSTTSPVRIMPGRIRWLARLCSKSWAKLSVIPSLARLAKSWTMRVHVLDPHPLLDPGCCHNGTRILRVPTSLHFRGRHPPHPSKRSARGPQSALRAQRENPLDHLLDLQIGGVDDDGIRRRLQWGDRTG